MNRILALFLSLFISIGNIHAETWKLSSSKIKPYHPIYIAQLDTKDKVDPFAQPYSALQPFEGSVPQAFSWEPEPYEFKLGLHVFNTYILQPSVPAPISGILISEHDASNIQRMFIEFQNQEQQIRSIERAECKKSLEERDTLCKQANESLTLERDGQKELIKTKLKLISSLETQNLWLKIGLGVAGGVLIGTVIYYEVR